MELNVCSQKERKIRIVLGLVLLSLVLLLEGAARLWGLLGVYPLATVYFGYCPLNRWMGVTPCRAAPRESGHA